MRRTYLAAIALLGACTHEATVSEAPVDDVPTSYGSEIPGKWSVYIDGKAFNGSVAPQGYGCAGMKYPFNASQAFAKSVLSALDSTIETVQPVSTPKPSQGDAGLISIRASDLRGDITGHTSWVSAGGFDVNISATIAIAVEGTKGRLLGTTVETKGYATGSSGIGCEGGADVTSQAVASAIKNASRKIGEAVGNSERIRAQ